jgi:hypothetical protein
LDKSRLTENHQGGKTGGPPTRLIIVFGAPAPEKQDCRP